MFSVEDQKKLAHWFQRIDSFTKECRACGRQDEAFTHPDLVCVPMAIPGQSRDLGRALHFLVRECRSCGYTMFFNAERIGLERPG